MIEPGAHQTQLRNVARSIGLMMRPASDANPTLDALMANLSSALERLDTQPGAEEPAIGTDTGGHGGGN